MALLLWHQECNRDGDVCGMWPLEGAKIMKNEVVVNGVKLTRDQVEAALEELNAVHQSTFANFRDQFFGWSPTSVAWLRKSGGLWLGIDFTWTLRLDSASRHWYLTGEKKS